MKLGIVMDPIQRITIAKDSSFAMLLSAQKRGWQIHYMEMPDLYLRDNKAGARMRRIEVEDSPDEWFRFGESSHAPLASLDLVLMRKDPPFDSQYLLATFILEQAEREGVLVVNPPRALRDANEKLFTLHVPQCIPPTIVTSCRQRIRDFLAEHGDIIVKPPDGMGGYMVFRLRDGDPNTGVILETVTARDSRYVIAQKYLPAISEGDKRILVIDGEPVPYALARTASGTEARANLAAGGSGKGVDLTAGDRRICEAVQPLLQEHGIRFAGLDVIGDYLTEINVTSPTCIRELDAIYGLDIAGDLLDRLQVLRNA